MDTDALDTPETPTQAASGFGEVLEGLTPPQKQAVMHTEGPLLVLAGPGSGKTRVITRRIAYLVGCGIPAWQILALTFTNKAAAEMRDRVVRLLGEGTASRGLTAATFHSLCARLLRRHARAGQVPGLTGTFAIYDTDDQTTLVKRAIEAAGLSTSNWPARSVLSRISAAKNELLGPQDFAAKALDFNDRTIARVYTEYQRALREANAADFDDLLLLTARMLETNQEVRAACQTRWRYLLIDEYQDTNRAQFVIASLIAGGDPNICVVGDPDQSIYGWRGADIGNILQFEKQFPRARVIPLGENFRSTGHIVAAADRLIRNNQRRKHKDLFTPNPPGEKVEVVLARDEHHEARLGVDWIKRIREETHDDGHSWSDFAIFYRTNALSRVIEDELRREGIPYLIVRGTAFFQREEIKSAIAYLRVVANPADSVSLERVVNTPARGIGDATMERVRILASERGLPLLDALRAAPGSLGLPARTANAIARFGAMIGEWAGIHAPDMLTRPAEHGSLAELVERVIRESGLEEMYRKQEADKPDEGVDRLGNLAELVSSARDFEDEYDPAADPNGDAPLDPSSAAPVPEPSLLDLLRAYLERVALVADADAIDPASGAVTLMTLHAAKGLEFSGVVMIGLEEGLLPHARVREAPSELEEERRLCFVGMTRAKSRLLITSARLRTVRGIPERTIPSRFLAELPEAHASVSDQGGFDEPGWDREEERERGNGGEWERGRRPREGGRASASGVHDVRGRPISVGDLVRHPQFGLGRIASITTGRDARAQINFRQVGSKTLVLQYARLERIEE